MVELRVPSLRDRAQDIPHFVEFFSNQFSKKYDRPKWTPTPEELAEFSAFGWPGNIRQLGHVIEQSYVLRCPPTLPNQLGEARLGSNSLPILNLAELRKTAVKQALKATNGHKGRAARLLGVHANTLTRMLAELDSE